MRSGVSNPRSIIEAPISSTWSGSTGRNRLVSSIVLISINLTVIIGLFAGVFHFRPLRSRLRAASITHQKRLSADLLGVREGPKRCAGASEILDGHLPMRLEGEAPDLAVWPEIRATAIAEKRPEGGFDFPEIRVDDGRVNHFHAALPLARELRRRQVC